MKKRILVTGGNRGIGKEICRQLVGMDHEVILTARDQVKGEKVANELGALFLPLDVSDEASIRSFLLEFKSQFGSLDVLINNAGIFIDGTKNVLDVDFETVQETLSTNVYGPWRLIQSLIGYLENSNDGRIVNISSGMGALNDLSGDHPAYRLSKTALNALTLMVHAQVGTQVAVNSMCPGWVRTDMGGSGASRPVEKGAETAVWLATSEEIPRGKSLRDMQIIDW